MPPRKGTNASKTLDSPATPPSLSGQLNRGRRLRTAKKKGCSLSTPAFDASPLHRKSQKGMAGVMPTQRRRNDKTKR